MIRLKKIAVAYCILMFISISACKPTVSKSTERHQERLENFAVIEQFNADRSTISDLQVAISEIASQGTSDIKFPTGEWHWYCPNCAHNEWNDLPKEKILAFLEAKADSFTTEELTNWLDTYQIRGVELSIDPNQPAEKFFSLEKVLRERRVKYWLSSDGEPGAIVIQEFYPQVVRLLSIEKENKPRSDSPYQLPYFDDFQ